MRAAANALRDYYLSCAPHDANSAEWAVAVDNVVLVDDRMWAVDPSDEDMVEALGVAFRDELEAASLM